MDKIGMVCDDPFLFGIQPTDDLIDFGTVPTNEELIPEPRLLAQMTTPAPMFDDKSLSNTLKRLSSPNILDFYFPRYTATLFGFEEEQVVDQIAFCPQLAFNNDQEQFQIQQPQPQPQQQQQQQSYFMTQAQEVPVFVAAPTQSFGNNNQFDFNNQSAATNTTNAVIYNENNDSSNNNNNDAIVPSADPESSSVPILDDVHENSISSSYDSSVDDNNDNNNNNNNTQQQQQQQKVFSSPKGTKAKKPVVTPVKKAATTTTAPKSSSSKASQDSDDEDASPVSQIASLRNARKEDPIVTGSKLIDYLLKPARKTSQTYIDYFPEKLHCSPYKYDMLIRVRTELFDRCNMTVELRDAETHAKIFQKSGEGEGMTMERTSTTNVNGIAETVCRIHFNVTSFHFGKKRFVITVTLTPKDGEYLSADGESQGIEISTEPFWTFARKIEKDDVWELMDVKSPTSAAKKKKKAPTTPKKSSSLSFSSSSSSSPYSTMKMSISCPTSSISSSSSSKKRKNVIYDDEAVVPSSSSSNSNNNNSMTISAPITTVIKTEPAPTSINKAAKKLRLGQEQVQPVIVTEAAQQQPIMEMQKMEICQPNQQLIIPSQDIGMGLGIGMTADTIANGFNFANAQAMAFFAEYLNFDSSNLSPTTAANLRRNSLIMLESLINRRDEELQLQQARGGSVEELFA